MPMTFAPSSAAEATTNMPPVPQPMTSTSVSYSATIWLSSISGSWPSQSPSAAFSFCSSTSTGISPLACLMHLSAALATAVEVIVEPETASISALCALISRALSSSAAAWP